MGQAEEGRGGTTTELKTPEIQFAAPNPKTERIIVYFIYLLHKSFTEHLLWTRQWPNAGDILGTKLGLGITVGMRKHFNERSHLILTTPQYCEHTILLLLK